LSKKKESEKRSKFIFYRDHLSSQKESNLGKELNGHKKQNINCRKEN
jgi:hypothetical protein